MKKYLKMKSYYLALHFKVFLLYVIRYYFYEDIEINI